MRGLISDLDHALRIYRRTPAASGLAVVVLAVAAAFVVAFVSLYVDLVLRPYPGIERAGRIVTLSQYDGTRETGLPAGLIDRMGDEMSSLEAAAGVIANAQQREGEERIALELLTREFFPGIRPELHAGRGFDEADHRGEAEPVAVVSYRYWQEELGGGDVIGTTIELEPQPMIVMRGMGDTGAPEMPGPLDFRIVGIMSASIPGFTSREVDVWLPFERALPLIAIGPTQLISTRLTLTTFGRRSDGAPTRAVAGELAGRFADSYAEFGLQANASLRVLDGLVSDAGVQRDSKRQLELFLVASILLALVAAANVSLFLLARAPGRRRELGIRLAVGAPTRRLARQLASEAGLLVGIAAALGLGLSIWLSQFLRGLAFLRRADWDRVTLLDWRVLGIVGTFLLVLTVLVSLAPVLGLKRLGIAATSRQIAARPSFAQRAAGTVQLAIGGTLAGAALAFAWHLGSTMLGDPGYATENRYVAQYSNNFRLTAAGDIQRMIERVTLEQARLRDAIEAIPGVAAVTFGQPVPGAQIGFGFTEVPDPRDPEARIRARAGTIDSHYVDVLGLRLVHGRAPTEADAEVVLLNQTLARRLFDRDDVVGEQWANFGSAAGPEIIGVLEDLSYGHPLAAVEPMVFMSGARSLSGAAVIETGMTAAALQQELERIAAAGEFEFTVNRVEPLDRLRSDLLAPDRARGWLTIGTACLVVLLAAFGFYGTQRYLVTAGRREYAIRASLGAGPKSLGRLVLKRGLLMSLPGLVPAVLLAFIVAGWLRGDFVAREVSPAVVGAGVLLAFVLLLLAASLSPAQEARRTQPAPLLRED